MSKPCFGEDCLCSHRPGAFHLSALALPSPVCLTPFMEILYFSQDPQTLPHTHFGWPALKAPSSGLLLNFNSTIQLCSDPFFVTRINFLSPLGSTILKGKGPQSQGLSVSHFFYTREESEGLTLYESRKFSVISRNICYSSRSSEFSRLRNLQGKARPRLSLVLMGAGKGKRMAVTCLGLMNVIVLFLNFSEVHESWGKWGQRWVWGRSLTH